MNVPDSLKQEAKSYIERLISKMTLTEKVGQLSQFGTSIYNNNVSYHEDHYAEGKIGSFLTIKGAHTTNSIQKKVIKYSRLGIPVLFADDVIHGFRTTFPTPIAQSCSWNPDMAFNAAEIAAKEAYCAGIKWVFSPMVDIARDPRWGRIVEGYGEDTYLCSLFADAVVRGYEGSYTGEKYHVLSCLKHFVGYGACIGGRDYNEVDMSIQTLYDVYLPSFNSGVAAGSSTVMTAFNTLNGVPCTGNQFLLKNILRKKFGFDGLVVSDSSSVADLIVHGYADNESDAAKKAFESGVDMNMSGEIYNDNIPHLIESDSIEEKNLNTSVKRVLFLKYILGLFSCPYVNESEENCFFCNEHLEVSRQAAEESIVLLKNENEILPIRKSIKRISVIGPLAKDKKNILGPWACNPDYTKTISIYDGIKNMIGKDVKLDYAMGCTFDSDDDNLISEAVEVIKKSELAILVLGEQSCESGEAKSKSCLQLSLSQQKLWESAIKSGTPVIVLISAGRPLIFNSLADKSDAILYIWQLGTCAGNAVANIIFGKNNPSGHLTTSFPCCEGQIPVYYNHSNTGHPALGRVWYESKYLDAPIKPRYCFGYGMSYTKFVLSDLNINKKSISTNELLIVSCIVKNTGIYDGAAVIQLYIRDIVASCVRPLKQLKGFKKVFIKSGEKALIKFKIRAEDTAFCGQTGERIIEPGKFSLWIGQNCEDEALTGSFSIIG